MKQRNRFRLSFFFLLSERAPMNRRGSHFLKEVQKRESDERYTLLLAILPDTLFPKEEN
jgi:hypothetical protein